MACTRFRRHRVRCFDDVEALSGLRMHLVLEMAAIPFRQALFAAAVPGGPRAPPMSQSRASCP
jgi:hypothetical protein